MSWHIIEGDARNVLAEVEDGSVQTCVTSPPYFGLRDYGTATWEGGDPDCDHVKTTQHREQPERPKGWDGAFRNTSQPLPVSYSGECGKCGASRVDSQIGLEETPAEYVAHLVDVFREVRRTLRKDGTVWLNLGDSYNAYNGNRGSSTSLSKRQEQALPKYETGQGLTVRSLKPKDLIGIPWRVALALQDDGWYLRSDIIWSKPNPMPESVTDRPTRSHEYVFLLTKSDRYYYDADAIKEPDLGRNSGNVDRKLADGTDSRLNTHLGRSVPWEAGNGRNKRSVWTVATKPYPGAHFATFPPKLIEPCVLAGTKKGDVVLDPFAGAGTTAIVSLLHERHFVGVELNPGYIDMATERIQAEVGLFA